MNEGSKLILRGSPYEGGTAVLNRVRIDCDARKWKWQTEARGKIFPSLSAPFRYH